MDAHQPTATTGRAIKATEPDSLLTRSSLLGRLRDLDDSDSWRTFFETYWRLLYNVARKSGLPDAEAQDVVQETVIAVARKLPGFHYDSARGSFKQWLLLIARRRIHDHLRRTYRSLPVADGTPRDVASRMEELPTDSLSPDAAFESAWETEWRENIFQAALARVRQRVKPKHFQVFDGCVLQGLPAAKIGRMLGLNAAQVYLARHRVSQAVKRAAREIESELNRATC